MSGLGVPREREAVRGGGSKSAASPVRPLLSFPSVSHFSPRVVHWIFHELKKREVRQGQKTTKRRAKVFARLNLRN